MLYGVYVYQCSNSLGRASRILEPFVERSHESIRQWVQRLAPVCDEFDVDRRLVTAVFVDETMIRIRGREAWVVSIADALRAQPEKGTAPGNSCGIGRTRGLYPRRPPGATS